MPVILTAAAVIELGHTVVLRRPWSDYDYSMTLVFGVALSALWLAAAAGLFLKRSWGWLVGFYATFALVIHGAVLRIGEATTGIVYFLAGAVAVVLLVRHARGYGFHLDPRERRSLA